MLESAASCQEFIKTQHPAQIALQLRRDQASCRRGSRPSPLAFYLPPKTSSFAEEIASHLFTNGGDYEEGSGNGPVRAIPKSILHLHYEGVVVALKAKLNGPATDEYEDGNLDPRLAQQDAGSRNGFGVPTTAEIETATRVLESLCQPDHASKINKNSPLQDVLLALQEQLAVRAESGISIVETSSLRKGELSRGLEKCYICRYINHTPHELYSSLCRPCGAFNLAESALSSPDALRLESMTALVTGGRINLGFHVASRLLRCGAYVIVSSRYPLDALSRYQAQDDFDAWSDRLRVVGADFRAAKDAFALAGAVKEILVGRNGKLDILVNNAAQTLTDTIRTEETSVSREKLLAGDPLARRQLVCSRGYQPRVRGGASGKPEALTAPDERCLESDAAQTKDAAREDALLGMVASSTVSTSNKLTNAGNRATKSSWIQSLREMPYEDIISAHSVNTFVPLILCRELLSSMSLGRGGGAGPKSTNDLTGKPSGYILNVSSREGIFDSRTNSAAKQGRHVHANMSKAALNMVTETEAAVAWKSQRVAMNSIDPGYMSADPQLAAREGFRGCPIG